MLRPRASDKNDTTIRKLQPGTGPGIMQLRTGSRVTPPLRSSRIVEQGGLFGSTLAVITCNFSEAEDGTHAVSKGSSFRFRFIGRTSDNAFSLGTDRLSFPAGPPGSTKHRGVTLKSLLEDAKATEIEDNSKEIYVFRTPASSDSMPVTPAELNGASLISGYEGVFCQEPSQRELGR